MNKFENLDIGSIILTRQTRRAAVQNLFKTALVAGSVGALSRTSQAQAHEGPLPSGGGLDAAVLNFALNLEYLEAEFYCYATTGQGLEAQGVAVTGAGTPGTVTVKPNPRVPFTNTLFEQFAEELTADEVAHVKFLRTALAAAGVQPVARPAIDLRDSFSGAAQAAGVIPAGGTFDPFANETNFILGSFVFEDVGVTAYKGGARLLTNKDFLESAAGILAAEAYHAGVIRTFIYQLGGAAIQIAQQISDLRDAVDGADDRDQGVVLNNKANLFPSDANGIAFSRTPRQVLNIVYLGENATKGGFFPNGLNGVVR